MDTTGATEYLPVDLLGIGSTPVLLLIIAVILVVVGFVASSLMVYRFRTGIRAGLIALSGSVLVAFVLGIIAINGYHQTAASNLAENISTKYPELELQSAGDVLKRYILLTDSDSNPPLEVNVDHKGESITYRLDLSKGKAEPVLATIDGIEAPDPIIFMNPGSS